MWFPPINMEEIEMTENGKERRAHSADFKSSLEEFSQMAAVILGSAWL